MSSGNAEARRADSGELGKAEARGADSARRLVAALRTDVVLQSRNQLYAISVLVSVLGALALAWLSPPERLGQTVPMACLLFVGGSTMLYVVAMIILEKDDGTLHAVIVSPLRPAEYLGAKLVSLSAIAMLEGLIITLGATGILAASGAWSGAESVPVFWPGVMTWVGLLALAVLHVLTRIVLVVRHDRIMTALLPMGGIAAVFQLPAFYIVGAFDHPAWLLIPTAAPTVLMQAGFGPLSVGQWAYALVYTSASLAIVGVLALRSFHTHVVQGLR